MIPFIGWGLVNPNNAVVLDDDYDAEAARWLVDNVKPVFWLWRGWEMQYVGSCSYLFEFWRKSDAFAFKIMFARGHNSTNMG